MRRTVSLYLDFVQVLVTNTDTGESIPIDTYEFVHGLSTIKDEAKKLRIALDSGSEYTSPEAHDPIRQVRAKRSFSSLACQMARNVWCLLTVEPQLFCWNLHARWPVHGSIYHGWCGHLLS